MNRKKLSGAQYKKKSKERAEKLINVLNQTQKVDSFFKPVKENEQQHESISNIPQPLMNNDFNIIPSSKKQLLENQNPEPSTSSVIHYQSLRTPQDEIFTCSE